MSSMQVDKKVDIDESLYSRQIHVLGKEAMEKMANSNILIVGLNGLGVEITKNVALAGVKSIQLFDRTATTLADLSTQYYLAEKDIGQPRAASCVKKLAELNQYTPVTVVDDSISLESLLSEVSVVVVADPAALEYPHGEIEGLVALNNLARKSKTYFIWAQTNGLAGQIFNDFGPNFSVVDTNGEQPITGVVATIDSDLEVLAPAGVFHGLETGMVIQMSKVSPPSFNGQFKVTVPGPFSFILKERLDGKPLPTEEFVRGGEWKQIKQPISLDFKSLEQSLSEPDLFTTDFAKFDRPPQLLLAFLALSAFKLKHNGSSPRPWNEEDANEFVQLAENIRSQLPNIAEEINVETIKTFAKQGSGQNISVNTVIGGTCAQEDLKAVSGKFTPIKQFLNFDAFEAIPDDGVTEEDASPTNSRYDPYYAVWGQQLMNKIANLKVFLVGAGAIGCEVLKCWAMMGVGSGANGHITVTDNDNIERSNLNRQFLFRAKDVGHAKSDTASAAVREMNTDYKESDFTTYVEKVGPETESLFDESFWKSLDIVTNALDNVEARTYVDRRCILYVKPLVESGTLGTKGNVQIVVPHMTESYSSSSDPPEKSIPLCTLRSFPSKIDHTIAWGKAQFERLFTDAPNSVNAYLTQPNYVETTLKSSSNQLEVLQQILSYLVTERPLSFAQCIEWAANEFERFYNFDIRQLLYNFPPDAKTKSGNLFWEPPKKCPTPLDLDLTNSNIIEFIIAAANLRAYNYGLKGITDKEEIIRELANFKPEDWKPVSDLNIKVNDDDPDVENDNGDEITQIAQKLPAPSSLVGFKLHPCIFEKDDDSNFHIAFINAASNHRALNYGIDPVDFYDTKFIAGKIIPAIATTTAVVTGLSTLEAVKVVQQKKLEQYKNGFINLALPFFGFSEPIESPVVKYNGDQKFDKIWDRFTYGNITLGELIDRYEKDYGLSITMISCGSTLLFASFLPVKNKDRMGLTLSNAYETISKKKIPSDQKILILEVCADDKEGEEVDDLPFIVIELE